MSNIGKGTVVVYIEQIVNAICSFFISIILARYLGTGDFGLWKLLASVSIFVTFSSSFGIEMSLIRYIPFFLVQNERNNINKLIFAGLLIRVGSLFFLFILIIVFSSWLDVNFKTGVLFHELIVPTLVYLFVSTINAIVGRAMLAAYGKRHVLGIIKICTKSISLALIIIVVNYGFGFSGVMQSLVIIQCFEFFVFLLYAWKEIMRNIKLKSQHETFPIKRVLKFALPNHFFLSGHLLREYSVDNFVISHYMKIEDVAYYGISIAFPTYLRNFSPGRMLYGVLLPPLVKRFTEEGTNDSLILAFNLLQKITAFILWPVYLVCFVFTEEIIVGIYGMDYANAIFAARILLLFSIVQTATDPFYPICNTLEKPNIIFQTTVWGFLNLIGNILLVPIYGIEGAALATGLVSIGIYLHFYLVLKRKENMNLRPPKKISVVIINLLPTTIILLFIKYFDLSTMSQFFMLLISGIAYLMMCSYNKVFESEEKLLIEEKLRVKIPFI